MEQNLNNSESKEISLKPVIVALVVVIIVTALYTWSRIDNLFSLQEEPTEPELSIPVEVVQSAARRMKLYEAESAPVPQEGAMLTVQDAVVSDPVKGVLYFTGKVKDGPSSADLRVFALDLSVGGQTSVFVPELGASGMIEFKDPNDPGEYFLMTTVNTPASEADGTSVHAFSAGAEPMHVTQAGGVNERGLEWSQAAGLLAFSRKVAGDDVADRITPNTWEVVIVDPQSTSTTPLLVLEDTHQAKWSPDGQAILFLKSDGMYLYDRASGGQGRVIAVPEDGLVNTTTRFDMSSDGRYVVWTTAKQGIVTVFEITSWEPFIMVERGRVEDSQSEFYWPEFSPDGDYYVVQAIDRLQEGDEVRQNPRFEIRPTLGRNVVYTYPLSDFQFSALFTNDWTVSSQ